MSHWRQYPSAPTKRRHERKEAPFTDARTQAVLDSLDPDVHKRIKEEARAEAARVLAEFEQTRGRR